MYLNGLGSVELKNYSEKVKVCQLIISVFYNIFRSCLKFWFLHSSFFPK